MFCAYQKPLISLVGLLFFCNVSAQDPDIGGISFGSVIDDAKSSLDNTYQGMQYQEVINPETKKVNNLVGVGKDQQGRINIFVLSLTPEGQIWGVERRVQYQSDSRPHIDGLLPHFERYGGIPNDAPRVGYGGAQNIHYSWIELNDGNKLSGPQGRMNRSREYHQCYPKYSAVRAFNINGLSLNPEYPIFVSPTCRVYYGASVMADRDGIVSEVVIRGAEHSSYYAMLLEQSEKKSGADQSQRDSRIDESKKVDPGL